MTVDELIAALLELTEHDPTVGGWQVWVAPLVVAEPVEDVIDELCMGVVEAIRHSSPAGPSVELCIR